LNEKTFIWNNWINFTCIFLLIADLKKKIVAKVETVYVLFLDECKISTLINYLTNMCWTSYEPTVLCYLDLFPHKVSLKNSPTTRHERMRSYVVSGCGLKSCYPS
jgi:hypothetical protein